MNTRLQVEHPVTELVTGLDLVKLQIRVADGEKLPIRQEDITMRGAAIECRVYAEDPSNNFFPSPGRITTLQTPSGPGIRDDGGVYEGWTVPIDYDPMISKLAAWGATRDEAISRIRRALGEYRIEGIKTNISFFLEILDHPNFRSADFDTGFIDRWLQTRKVETHIPEQSRDFAALAAVIFQSENTPARMEVAKQTESPWKLDGRRRAMRGA
jgi:acetyl-CoA carboxylase, biotin carboxylase subunit